MPSSKRKRTSTRRTKTSKRQTKKWEILQLQTQLKPSHKFIVCKMFVITMGIQVGASYYTFVILPFKEIWTLEKNGKIIGRDHLGFSTLYTLFRKYKLPFPSQQNIRFASTYMNQYLGESAMTKKFSKDEWLYGYHGNNNEETDFIERNDGMDEWYEINPSDFQVYVPQRSEGFDLNHINDLIKPKLVEALSKAFSVKLQKTTQWDTFNSRTAYIPQRLDIDYNGRVIEDSLETPDSVASPRTPRWKQFVNAKKS
jgi:hypothetical protein